VRGSSEAGPVEPMQPPTTFEQMMKWRSGSIGLPGPTMRPHQPGLPVLGWTEATCWSSVRAWQTRTAFDLSAFSRP
jgi:hypothetical protein